MKTNEWNLGRSDQPTEKAPKTAAGWTADRTAPRELRTAAAAICDLASEAVAVAYDTIELHREAIARIHGAYQTGDLDLLSDVLGEYTADLHQARLDRIARELGW